MPAGEIHVGDTETILEYEIRDQDDAVVDVGDATLSLDFLRPNQTAKTTVTPSLSSDGLDGLIRYTVPSGFFDVPGQWRVQAHIQFGTQYWSSSVERFKVWPNV